MASWAKQRPFGGNQGLTLALRKKEGSLWLPMECSDSPEAGVGSGLVAELSFCGNYVLFGGQQESRTISCVSRSAGVGMLALPSI
jgi:hypothetical protein